MLAIGFLVGPLVGLYTTFVLMRLWNWFATEALHLPEISFWVMYGLVLIIGMFTPGFGDTGQEYSFKAIATAVDACVPDHKREWVSEQIEGQQSGIWIDVGFKIFGKIFGATCTLAVGFYKRGCQVKTLLLSREEGIFFGHPAQLAAPRTLSGARLVSPNASDICGIIFCVLSHGFIAPLSSVMAIANHGSI